MNNGLRHIQHEAQFHSGAQLGIERPAVVRKGDMATTGIPLIGIVDSDAWRIMANYKQYYIRDFKVGDTAWVWLDSGDGAWAMPSAAANSASAKSGTQRLTKPSAPSTPSRPA